MHDSVAVGSIIFPSANWIFIAINVSISGNIANNMNIRIVSHFLLYQLATFISNNQMVGIFSTDEVMHFTHGSQLNGAGNIDIC